MKPRALCLIFLITMLIAGCSPASPTSTALPGVDPITLVSAWQPTETPQPLAQPTTSATPAGATASPSATGPASQTAVPSLTAIPNATATPTLGPDGWKKLPVIPLVSDRVVEIYRHGQELGNNPHAFSKIGDCGSTPAWFLGDFDRGPSYYRLGKYQSLAVVIQQFQGSFDRTSLAARSGFNASALFVPLWADRSQCGADEGPLDCEYRVNKPVVAFIMLGANDVWHPQEFEPQMRKIIDTSIHLGVIPILSTKADDKEGNGSINDTIARLALEYQVPLWNFWLAADPLANNGLQEDMVHLTWGRNLFDDPDAMSKAWPVRNLTALQALDAVWQKINSE
jgi:hypothetical protein